MRSRSKKKRVAPVPNPESLAVLSARERVWMKPRPKIVTLIAWGLILPSVWRLFKMPVDWRDPIFRENLQGGPVPPDAHFAVVYVGLLVLVVAGAAILSGRTWCRWVLLAQVVLWSCYDLFYTRFDPASIQWAIGYVIATLFVFRRNAVEFFESATVMRATGRRHH
jgi:hypothetical protein